MEEKAKLKDRLREALNIRGLKAAELSERTDVPKGAISYYLAGKSHPKADRVHVLAQALDVSEAWLMGFNVPKERTIEQKKNDTLVGIVQQLRTDPAFYAVVEKLSRATPEQRDSIGNLLAGLVD